MIKSRRIDSFSKGMLVMKMKKMYLRHLNLRNFTIIQKMKKMKNNYLKFLELHTINLKTL